MIRNTVRTAMLALAFLCALPARADYEAGQQAWDAGRPDEALAQWRAAANAGDRRAMLALGRLYAQGLGAPQDYVEAHKWFNLAASRGEAVAVGERDALAAKMTPEHVMAAQALARSWRPAGVGGSVVAVEVAGTAGSTGATVTAQAPAAAVTPASSPAPASDAGPPPPRAIREAQALLAGLGYAPGPADGIWGRRTGRAYQAFLRDAGLPAAERLTPEALRAMRTVAKRAGVETGQRRDSRPSRSRSAAGVLWGGWGTGVEGARGRRDAGRGAGARDPWTPGTRTVRGLVIGIDDYAPSIGKLQGAVNDARNIHQALAGMGVDDLKMLLDGDATRDRILAEWQGLLERAERGDTLVLTYAGHGSQEPERVAGTERDGQDENLILGGFRRHGPGTRERIIDDEINQWFLDAGEKELKVVFVADSCHSGTLTRQADPRAPSLTYRYTPYTPMTGDSLELDLPEDAADTGEAGEGELAHVSFLAAGQEYETVPEIPVQDETGAPQRRGALSYTFARALGGEADADGDGALRRDELWRFVRENVRMMVEARQTPNLEPNRPDDADEIVLRLAPGPVPPPPGPVGHGAVRLAVRHAGPETLARARETLPGVRIVSDTDSPDLIWDTRQRHVITGLGDVAARDVDLEVLPGVIEKWKAVSAIKDLSARNSLRLRIHPNDNVHRKGRRIAVRVEELKHPRLTVFNLAGNGVVQYLYPWPSGPAGVAIDRPYELETDVVPPFGADHVVAVSAGSSLDALNATLRDLHGRLAAGRAVKLLAEARAGASDWSSGIQGLYTAP